MSEARKFPTRTVMSAVTGIVLCPFGDIHELLEWVAGESVWTHQLPRVSHEFSAAFRAARPDLVDVIALAETANEENYQEVGKSIVDQVGLTLSVTRLGVEEHERVDPLSELAEGVHPDRIVVAHVQSEK